MSSINDFWYNDVVLLYQGLKNVHIAYGEAGLQFALLG